MSSVWAGALCKATLGIETAHEAQIFGQGLTFFHLENWYSIHSVIRILFKLTGLYWRGRANAARVQVRHNSVRSKRLPAEFDGFTLLHMSDFHADTNEGAMRRVEKILLAWTMTCAFSLAIIAALHSGRLSLRLRACGRCCRLSSADLWRARQS